MPTAESDRRDDSRVRRLRAVGSSLAVALVVVVTLAALAPTPACAGAAPEPRLAILVLAPYLTFSDLSPTATPELWRLAQTGALGAMNARTADPDQPNAVSGALTISASRWASVPLTAAASAADIAALQAMQDGSLTQPLLGSLGSAIHAAGGRTAAISAEGVGDTLAASRRPAELVAMDTAGRIDLAPSSEALSASRRGHPLPSSTGYSAESWFTRDAIAALRGLTSANAPALLVVDSIGMTTASETASLTASETEARHRAALWELDRMVGALTRLAPEGTMLMVVAPATSKSWYQAPQFAPVIVAGHGLVGELSSPSTHRAGLVSNFDVAPTVLAALGIGQAQTMLGSGMTARATTTALSRRLARLSSADESVGIVDQVREAWFIRWFAGLALAVIAFAVWVIARGRRNAALRWPATGLVTLMCAIPSAAWLIFGLNRYPESIASLLGALTLTAAAVTAVLMGMRWYAARRSRDAVRGALVAALAASMLTSLVIVGDQWLSDPLRTGLFSYSVRAGWRYYGMGNEGAALLVGASLVAVGIAAELLADTRWAVHVRRWAIPVSGAIVLLTAAAPFAGANAGVAIWGVVAYAAAWAALNGVRPTLRTTLITAGLVVAAVATFVVIDLVTSGGQGTHLAKFALGIFHGDLAATREMVGRKLANNLGYFVATPYTLLFLGLGGVFFLLRRSSRSVLRAALEPFSAIRSVLLGAFVGGLFALATEDSSSVMPALLWFAAIMPVLLVALSQPAALATPESSASENSSK